MASSQDRGRAVVVGVSPSSSFITDKTRMLDHRATLPIQHGGNQSAIRTRLKLGNQPLLDFSAPLNALGPPRGAVAAVRAATESIDRYPEPGSPRLVERLAEYHGVPGRPDHHRRRHHRADQPDRPGAPRRPDPPRPRAGRPRDGPSPTSSSRPTANTAGPRPRTACAPRSGTTTSSAGTRTSFPERTPTGIFWTGHPNNPTGRAWDRDRLLALIDRVPGAHGRRRRGLPRRSCPTRTSGPSSAPRVDRDNVIVLRSMTKIYAFPGLRIGYAVAAPDMVDPAPPLPAALDRHHRRRGRRAGRPRRRRVPRADDRADRDRVGPRSPTGSGTSPASGPSGPAATGPTRPPPPPNFVLVSLVDTPWTSIQVQDALARRGLFVRECSNYSGLEVGAVVTGPGQAIETRGHLRFCVRTPAENDLLVETLRSILASRPPT